jgi:hypothetical protein
MARFPRSAPLSWAISWASVTGNRRETCQSRCLFGGYLTKPGYFCDQHRAGDRPNPGNGP